MLFYINHLMFYLMLFVVFMLSRFGNDVAYFHFFNQLMFLVYVLSCFRPVLLFVTLRTIALQALLSMGILQARILEWVAVPSSRGSS